MRTFTDNASRSWDVTISVDTIKAVKDALKENLLAIVTDEKMVMLKRLAEDPVFLCDVLAAVCREQLEVRKVSADDFRRAMSGDAVDSGLSALWEGAIDFFPEKRRAMLRHLKAKMLAFGEKGMALAETALNDPAFEEQADAALQSLLASGSRPTTPIASAGSLPDTSALTPAGEPLPS